MSEFFYPYEGNKPYAFISYSHLNSDEVLRIISPLHNQKYRIWYDEGIPAGDDWPANIARHVRTAAAILFFVSASSLASANCFNEMHEAKKLNKPVLCVRLDESELPTEWSSLIGNAPMLTVQDEPVDTMVHMILRQGTIDPTFLGDGTNDDTPGLRGTHANGWMIGAMIGAAVFAATVVVTYILANHWPVVHPQTVLTTIETPEPTASPMAVPTIDLDGPWASMLLNYVSFPDEQQERAVRASLDQSTGDILETDLLKITQLHFCGNMVLQNDAGIAFDHNGICSVYSAPVIQGSISDLGLIADMLALERLSLVCQQIESLAPLASLERLTELNAAGNPITDAVDLSGMLSLHTLHLEHTQIKDLSSLNELGQLKTVTVSADMFPLQLDAATQRFDVVLVP